jgi:hypothetical protein
MSLPLAIALILTADAALIGLLAFVMSRAGLLTPHRSKVLVAAHTAEPSGEPARSTPRSTRYRRPTGAPLQSGV